MQVDTVDFVLPSPKAFLTIRHVITELNHLEVVKIRQQGAFDLSYNSSYPDSVSATIPSTNDDDSSPEYLYTPMKITTSNIHSDQKGPPKPVLMRLTRVFVLKTRRNLTSTDVTTVKVFINVYSGQITGVNSDSVRRDSKGFSLYVSQKMSNVSDRRGLPSLLFHVAFEDTEIEKYKEANISDKVIDFVFDELCSVLIIALIQIIAALNDIFDDCLDSSNCIFLQLANNLKGS